MGKGTLRDRHQVQGMTVESRTTLRRRRADERVERRAVRRERIVDDVESVWLRPGSQRRDLVRRERRPLDQQLGPHSVRLLSQAGQDDDVSPRLVYSEAFQRVQRRGGEPDGLEGRGEEGSRESQDPLGREVSQVGIERLGRVDEVLGQRIGAGGQCRPGVDAAQLNDVIAA